MRLPSISARRQLGFTLIELMIVVAIVGVLAAIAFASYQSYVIKARRSAAAVCLQQGAQLMERYYTAGDGSGKVLTYDGAPAPTCPDLSKFYTVGFASQPTASAFKLIATPTLLQKDTKCGVLGLDQAGTRTASLATDPRDCW
ncbi:MAG: type IV pilin protein [Xanthomonas sp.]